LRKIHEANNLSEEIENGFSREIRGNQQTIINVLHEIKIEMAEIREKLGMKYE
jgi:hypothetical protein